MFKKKSKLDPNATYNVGMITTTVELVTGETETVVDTGYAAKRVCDYGEYINIENINEVKVLEKRSRHGFFQLEKRWVPVTTIKDLAFKYEQHRKKETYEELNETLGEFAKAAETWVSK